MGTPFIAIILLIVLVCVAVALIVGRFMHTNNGIDAPEAEPLDASSATTDGVPVPTVPAVPGVTGPLPPFIVNPTQPLIMNPTQPLSEIYYPEGPPPDAPNSAPASPAVPLLLPDALPATGSLPIYHHNQ